MSDFTELRWADVPSSELNIPATLRSGQAFRWTETPDGEWRGAVRNAVLRVRPSSGGFAWQTYPESNRWDLVEDYFALDVSLERLRSGWLVADPGVAEALELWRGIRVLRQEPEEAFFAFVCACCNTVTKIGRSVRALASLFGEPIAEINGEVHYRFPDLERLAGISEAFLREHLWGFRAPRVPLLAKEILARGAGWLDGLADRPYEEARAELAALPGIGLKIADCICVFGLGFNQAVPVDTHIWQFIVREMRPDLRGKTLTPFRYLQVSDAFRARFGPYSGWLQQCLFYEEMTARRGYANARIRHVPL